jgi:hypothetical protein
MAVFQDWEFNCILAGQLRSVSETSALIVQISDLGGAIALKTAIAPSICQWLRILGLDGDRSLNFGNPIRRNRNSYRGLI